MVKELDCRGLSCPGPVVSTKKALEEMEEGALRVLVDSSAAFENVKRFAQTWGCAVTGTTRENDFVIEIRKESSGPIEKVPLKASLKVTAYVNSDTIGVGPEELGRILMRAFLKTLPEVTPAVTALVFLNRGVHCAVEGSAFLETLRDLECAGLEIHSCGTCLDYFGMMDKVKAGKVSNMYEILQILAGSDRVVRP
ncbi:MAG: sulfurtransferase-like selenium metabolism protein YedF [Candidatus Eremiobacteraeota bacterium]|nr:sulfurtransferase-like selenium metabolism protein YedF [Candidatus Eremiobacteraeota bacterium]